MARRAGSGGGSRPAGTQRSPAELRQAAYRRGARGQTATDWIRAEPGHMAAYDQGRAAFADRMDRTPAAPHLPAPAPPSPGSGAGRSFTQGVPNPGPALRRGVSIGGDGGGILLAFVLYPVVLSVIKYGASGPALWFRAKWLNETTAQPNNLGPVTASLPAQTNLPPAAGGAGPGPVVTTPRPPGWQGEWPPPGSQPPLTNPTV